MKTTLNINGGLQVVDVVEGTPLLWVLRDHLELTGTKFGCGKGLFKFTLPSSEPALRIFGAKAWN